jgi:hypothetical protein
MEKKAKITRVVFKNEWSGPNGKVFYHEVELDNGDKGQIGCKEKEPAKLNPGCELIYTIEKTDKGTKIKAVNTNPSPFAGGGKKGPDPKVQIVGFAMSYTKDLIIGGKVDIKLLPETFEKIHSLMASKL